MLFQCKEHVFKSMVGSWPSKGLDKLGFGLVLKVSAHILNRTPNTEETEVG